MTQTWAEAAALYQKNGLERGAWKALQNHPKRATLSTLEPAIATVSLLLQQFLESEQGRDACRLLSASRENIVFGKRGIDATMGPYQDFYILDGEGLWVVTNLSDKPEYPILPLDAVLASALFSHRHPEDILSWLSGELDSLVKTVSASEEDASGDAEEEE